MQVTKANIDLTLLRKITKRLCIELLKEDIHTAEKNKINLII